MDPRFPFGCGPTLPGPTGFPPPSNAGFSRGQSVDMIDMTSPTACDRIRGGFNLFRGNPIVAEVCRPTGFGSTVANGAAIAGGFGPNATAPGVGFAASTSFANPVQPITFGASVPSPSVNQPAIPSTATQSLYDDMIQVSNIASAVTIPGIFNDARDQVLSLWNQVQAKWGVGRGYHSQSASPVAFTPDNPFCKFIAVGYNALASTTPEEGLVSLLVSRSIAEVRNSSPSFAENFHKEIIKNPNISVIIDSMTEVDQNRVHIVIFCVEKSPTGSKRKYSSTEVLENLSNPGLKAPLINLGVTQIEEKVDIPKHLLDKYLATPPKGVDPLLWEQAKNDNPNPKKYVPVVFLGFGDINRRFEYQHEQQQRQRVCLEKMTKLAEQLEKKNIATRCVLDQFNRKQQELAHRVLQIVVAGEIKRKLGVAASTTEQKFRADLEVLSYEIDTNTRNRINKLQEKMRSTGTKPVASIQPAVLDAQVSQELSVVIGDHQKGMAALIKILKEDIQTIDSVEKLLRGTAPMGRDLRSFPLLDK